MLKIQGFEEVFTSNHVFSNVYDSMNIKTLLSAYRFNHTELVHYLSPLTKNPLTVHSNCGTIVIVQTITKRDEDFDDCSKSFRKINQET